jgi:two-component system CAI-1 autoinducer sensor kinase/phosphatase CqsS
MSHPGNLLYAPSRSRQQIRYLQEAIFGSPLELIGHYSDARLRILGMLFFFGEPIYWFFWAVLFPQPYESLALRVLAMVIAVPLIFPQWLRRLPGSWMGWYVVAVLFVSLTLSFFWLYAGNAFSWMWLASCVAMIYILYGWTDWRVATAQLFIGIPIGIVAGWNAAGATSSQLPPTDVLFVQAFVLLFCIITALLMAASGANTRLERLKASLTTLAIMAHEFRTPFASAGLLSSKILKEAENLPEGRAREQIMLAARQLISTQESVNGLINYQLVNARYMEPLPDLMEIDASAELERAVSDFPFHPAADRERLGLEVEPGVMVIGHPETFRHVIYNLLSNAKRAVSRARPRMRAGDLSITLNSEKGHAILTVEDKGVGIPPQQLARLFDPYQSTQTQLAHGLGLAMVKRSISKMGGAVHCDSVEGQGTTFVLRIPLAATSRSSIFSALPAST